MASQTTRIRLPEPLLLERQTGWSPRFLGAIATPRPELEKAVDEMREAIHRARR